MGLRIPKSRFDSSWAHNSKLGRKIPPRAPRQARDMLRRAKSAFVFAVKSQSSPQLIESVLSLKEAAEIEKTSNHLEWKKFFQKIGFNPEIKDKTVSIRWGELWDFRNMLK